jgi:O-antigen/teichoic acid export membrane protein
MGVVIRQSARNLVFTYGGFLIGAFNTLVLMPRALTREQIGLLNTFTSYSWILAMVCLLGMPMVILRFYPLTSGIRRARLLGGAFMWSLSLALGVALSGWLFPGLIHLILPEAEPVFLRYYRWIFFMLIMHVLYENVASVLKSQMRTAATVFWRELFLRLYNLMLYGLFALGLFGYSIVVAGYALSSAVILIGLTSHLRLEGLLKLGFWMEKEWLRYGLYNLIGASLVFIVYQLDIVMLHRYGYLEVIAVYSIAMFMATTIQLPFRAFSAVGVPVLAQAFATGDMAKVKDVYRRSSEVMLVTGGALALTILWCAEEFRFFLPADYRPHLLKPLGFLVLAKWLDVSMGLNGALINQSRHYRFDIWANLILLVAALGLNVLFIPSLGLSGAALATCISVVIYNLVRYFYIVYRFGIHGFGWNFPGIVIFYAVTYAALSRLPLSGHPMGVIALKILIAGVVILFWLRVFHPSSEMERLIKGFQAHLVNLIIRR